MSNLFTKGTSDLTSTTKVAAFLELLTNCELLDDESSQTRITLSWGDTDTNQLSYSVSFPYMESTTGEVSEITVTNVYDAVTASDGAFTNTGSDLDSNDYPNAIYELAKKILFEEISKSPAVNNISINLGQLRTKILTISGTIDYAIANVSGKPTLTAFDYLA